ncbi:MAG TPA: hypothetical protein VER03_02780, partial [Bryobacteraceae bacterium]|nr:hypothetical protein [Bryobacteraceae bacterium]
RLYIFIATIHLLVITATLYRMDLFKAGEWGRPLAKMIDGIAKERNTTAAQIDEAASHHLAKAYAIAQYFAVLGFAVFPWLLYRRRKPYYVQHFIFSLHIYSFYFLGTGLMGLLVSGATWVRSPSYLITLVYLWFALRRLYGESWGAALWKAVILRIGLFITEGAVVGIALFYAIFRLKQGH